jgi:hypothetical protein
MTPATDAAREARAREIAWKLVIGEKVGGGDGQTYVGRTPTVREIEAALLAFADTEAASQPREGEGLDERKAINTILASLLNALQPNCPDFVERIRLGNIACTQILALTRRPPEQAGAVPAGMRVVAQAWIDRAMQIEAAADVLHSHCRDAIRRAGEGSGRLYAANIAQIGKAMEEVAVALNTPEPVFPAAPTPPDAGIGSDGAGEMRCPACHVKFRKIDDVDAHIASLATQPGDGGRS